MHLYAMNALEFGLSHWITHKIFYWGVYCIMSWKSKLKFICRNQILSIDFPLEKVSLLSTFTPTSLNVNPSSWGNDWKTVYIIFRINLNIASVLFCNHRLQTHFPLFPKSRPLNLISSKKCRISPAASSE